MAGRLDGRVVAITGAAQGIGRACAERFCAEGARVVLNDLDAAGADAAVAALAATGATAVACAGDVSDPDTARRLVATSVDRFGGLDVLHCNAGIGVFGKVGDLSDADWRQQFAVVVDGAFYCIRAALGVMVPAGRGAIVTTVSGAGLLAEHNMAAYTSAKHALIGLTKATAVEYAEHGIRANAMCPGPVHTPAFDSIDSQIPGGVAGYGAKLPLGRIGTPAEIASLAAFLASDDASYLSGAVIAIDGSLAARLPTPPLFG
jgi:NAD(P)-dependent dehydrogenase (short-subunit alcohol dehydrogenase family)